MSGCSVDEGQVMQVELCFREDLVDVLGYSEEEAQVIFEKHFYPLVDHLWDEMSHYMYQEIGWKQDDKERLHTNS